jgi:hypothetical protein
VPPADTRTTGGHPKHHRQPGDVGCATRMTKHCLTAVVLWAIVHTCEGKLLNAQAFRGVHKLQCHGALSGVRQFGETGSELRIICLCNSISPTYYFLGHCRCCCLGTGFDIPIRHQRIKRIIGRSLVTKQGTNRRDLQAITGDVGFVRRELNFL